MSTLYELTGSFQQVMDMVGDPEVDNQMILDTLEGIEFEIEEKAENYAKLMKNIESDIDGLKGEEKRLAEKRKTLENKVKFLKDNLENAMRLTGKTKFKTPLFSFNIQKNPASLSITDEDSLPKKYFISQPDKIDTTKLKDALKEGQSIPGAELTQGESLRIR